MEIRTELTIDDFEEGDRVYHRRGNVFSLGTVRRIYVDPFNYLVLTVALDAGNDVFFSEPLTGLGKILPLNRLEQGMIISRWASYLSQREFFRVEEYVPGEFLTLQALDSSLPPRTIEATTSRMELEKELMDWEIEG